MQTIEKYFHTFNFPTFYFAVSLSLSHTWSYLHTRVVFGQILLQIMRGTHVLHSNLKGDAFLARKVAVRHAQELPRFPCEIKKIYVDQKSIVFTIHHF